jgi:hypothetical protein
MYAAGGWGDPPRGLSVARARVAPTPNTPPRQSHSLLHQLLYNTGGQGPVASPQHKPTQLAILWPTPYTQRPLSMGACAHTCACPLAPVNTSRQMGRANRSSTTAELFLGTILVCGRAGVSQCMRGKGGGRAPFRGMYRGRSLSTWPLALLSRLTRRVTVAGSFTLW